MTAFKRVELGQETMQSKNEVLPLLGIMKSPGDYPRNKLDNNFQSGCIHFCHLLSAARRMNTS